MRRQQAIKIITVDFLFACCDNAFESTSSNNNELKIKCLLIFVKYNLSLGDTQ